MCLQRCRPPTLSVWTARSRFSTVQKEWWFPGGVQRHGTSCLEGLKARNLGFDTAKLICTRQNQQFFAFSSFG
jgi:hypothetical protein